MDFDLSKENIQPLRGGRNVSQLEVALQAQSDAQLQQELLQQKSTFEEAIRTYDGDDPLDNWYNYISWVEQSYPKHGHEGNLVPLLEDCLSKFEHDERHFDDRRFCKLWIKYIYLQQNPLELFQLLYSKGICKSCADLYRAWAYYHEEVGDYQRADKVFQLGLRDMAQPYEDLVFAHKNMYEAIGRQTIQGVDERRLLEQRQALTSLRSYKHNHRTVVTSVRVGHQILNSAPGSLQQYPARSERNSNVPIALYEDSAIAGPSVQGACAVVSILDAAKKQEVHKENTLKPGTWKKSIINNKLPQNRTPLFSVHEDEDSQYAGGIRLPPDFYQMNHDDFSDWVSDIYYAEPYDNTHVPMYPKHLVYAKPNIEYSLEEIRARNWFAKKLQKEGTSVDMSAMQETMMEEANIVSRRRHTEVEQAVQSILPSSNERQYEMEQPRSILSNEEQNFNMERHSLLEQNYTQHDSISRNMFVSQHSIPQIDQNFSMPQHVDHQAHMFNSASLNFNPGQPFLTQNISGFHLANSTNLSTDQRMNQPPGSIRNIIEQQQPSIPSNARQSVSSHIYHQNYPQEEVLVPKLATTENNSAAECYIFNQNQSHSKTGSYYQQGHVSSNSRLDVQTSLHLNSPNAVYQPMFQPHVSQLQDSAKMYQQHVSQSDESEKMYQQLVSQSDESAKMYQPHLSYSQPSVVPVYQSNESSHLINSGIVDISKPLIPQQQQQWMSNNAAMVQKPQPQWPNTTLGSDDNYTVNMREAIKDINEIWKDNTCTMKPQVELKKPEITKFQILEDTNPNLQDSKNRPICNTGVKRCPFKPLTDTETETAENKNVGNNLRFSTYEADNKHRTPPQKLRPSMRAPFTSPATETEPQCARKTATNIETQDEFTRPADVKKPATFAILEDNAITNMKPTALNDSCTTQTFNFNLNQASVSTPFNFKKVAAQQYANATIFNNAQADAMKHTKKGLFDDIQAEVEGASYKKSDNSFASPEENEEKLSVIFENSKESRFSSSSSSGGTTLKTSTFHPESLKAIPEASHSNEESMKHETIFKKQEVTHCHETIDEKETRETPISNYDVLKMFLKEDHLGDTHQQSYLPPTSHFSPANQYEQVIDLTDETVNMKTNNVEIKDAMQPQQLFMTNYESPMKNQFREMSCDSNDALSTSPTKGIKMDIDFQALIAQNSNNSNSELHMEQETQDVSMTQAEEPILFQAPFNPFSNILNAALLKKVGFPNPKYSKQYFELQTLPRLTGRKEVACFMDEKFLLEKAVGKGSFGSVYKARCLTRNKFVALKFQKPGTTWEYYITKEVSQRLVNPYMQSAFMDVIACFKSPTASVLVTEFFKIGSLLDIKNKVKEKTGKAIKELVAIYYASEIITIVNTLHKCKIIHADIKPDNFLVTKMPPEFGYPSLQLIDFGRSIDMSLFPEGTSFTDVVITANFICPEMKTGRPWSYQTDIFCIAATVHVLLFDKYMELQKLGNVWSIAQNIPRYMRKDLWKTFFFQMLNIEGCDKLPNLNDIKAAFETITSAQSEELQTEMKYMANMVLDRSRLLSDQANF